jgi:hypothetical protein
VTTPANEPGERPPRLDRPPSDRYRSSAPVVDPGASAAVDAIAVPLGLIVGGGIAFVVLGGILLVTAGLVVVSAFFGWLTGRLVSPPLRATAVGLAVVAVGLLGVWLFGRVEGGVMDPVPYLLEVEGAVVVILCFLTGGGLAAAASR